MSPVSPVFAIILAAGRSSRFGGDKLLAPLHGRPLLAHVLEAAMSSSRAGIVRVVYLVVRDAGSLEARLGQAAEARVIVAERAAEGLALSLRAGLDRVAAVAPATGAAALVLLGDQPGVRREVIAEVIRRWRTTGAPAVRPRYADRPDEPGHPVLIDRQLWAEVAALEGDTGPGQFLRGRAVELVDVPGRNPDIDTPGDLAEFPPMENT